MRNAVPPKHEAGIEPLDDAVDHVRGGSAGRLVVADRTGAVVLGRVRRDVQSGMASGEVLSTPTLFIDGVVHRGGYDAATFGGAD
jgi:hypothetical protein